MNGAGPDQRSDGRRFGTSARDELELLGTLAELYEETHDPIDPPDPVEVIKFR
jgi:HTH-type transcriptional regulator/antitoxin HigA